MKVIGLTGGVGMGKSAAASFLARREIPIIDTDLLARELVEPGQPALDEIRVTFGPGVFDSEGRLNREVLADVVFSDEAKRRALEKILHPLIHREWQKQIDGWRREGIHRAAVVVIPLLFETGSKTSFDAVLCVACSPATQASRLQARGWSREHQQQRIAAQWPTEKKMELATAVIWTEASLKVHEDQIERIVSVLGLAGS